MLDEFDQSSVDVDRHPFRRLGKALETFHASKCQPDPFQFVSFSDALFPDLRKAERIGSGRAVADHLSDSIVSAVTVVHRRDPLSATQQGAKLPPTAHVPKRVVARRKPHRCRRHKPTATGLLPCSSSSSSSSSFSLVIVVVVVVLLLLLLVAVVFVARTATTTLVVVRARESSVDLSQDAVHVFLEKRLRLCRLDLRGGKRSVAGGGAATATVAEPVVCDGQRIRVQRRRRRVLHGRVMPAIDGKHASLVFGERFREAARAARHGRFADADRQRRARATHDAQEHRDGRQIVAQRSRRSPAEVEQEPFGDERVQVLHVGDSLDDHPVPTARLLGAIVQVHVVDERLDGAQRVQAGGTQDGPDVVEGRQQPAADPLQLSERQKLVDALCED